MRRIIGIIGGTGKQGTGLALRWGKSHEVIVGSRDRERAEAHAKEVTSKLGESVTLRGASNADAAREADVVVLSVPYASHAATLSELAPALEGKVLVDLTVPLKPPRVTEVSLPAGQSAALEGKAILGEKTRIVAALHHVSSVHLGDVTHPLEGDVLVAGDDAAAKDIVIELIADLGMRGIDAGPLVNAIALEALTPALLYINRRYKVRGAGLRILGVT